MFSVVYKISYSYVIYYIILLVKVTNIILTSKCEFRLTTAFKVLHSVDLGVDNCFIFINPRSDSKMISYKYY